MSEINHDVLEMIFSYLDTDSLKAVSAVSRLWNSVTERPKFWSWARLIVDRDNYKDVLRSSRVHIVPEIKIITLDSWQGKFLKIMENLFTALLDDRSQLKKLEVKAQSESERLLSLDTALLSQALVRLEECSFSFRCSNHNYRQLSRDQLVGVFTAIDQTDPDNLNLKSLNFPHLHLLEVPPEVLVSALVKLEKTDILQPSIQFSSELTTCLMTKLAEGSIVNIKRLELCLMKCSNVSPEIFAAALLRIETVDLTCSGGTIDAEQLSALFSQIAETGEMKLRELELSRVNISHVSPAVISEAAVKLEIFNARGCDLTTEQISAVFTKLSKCKNHKLRILKLNWNNLKSVPTKTLVSGISGLEELDLRQTSLTTEQLTGLYTQLATLENHKLRILNLDWNYLSSVPTETLVGGISGLEEVGLLRTRLTPQQGSAILSRLSALTDHRLRSLNLDANDLSSVPTETLVGGISGLETVCLYDTWLTTEHLTEIYRMVAERKCSRLRQINLGGNNISSISPDLRDGAKLNESVKIKN